MTTKKKKRQKFDDYLKTALWILAALVLGMVLFSVGCAALQETGEWLGALFSEPGVVEKAADAAGKAASGNWWGAAAAVGTILFGGGGILEYRRRKRKRLCE